MKKQFALLILILFAVQSCKNDTDKTQDLNDTIVIKSQDTIIENTEKNNVSTIYNSKYLDIENALVNDHKAILSREEFDALHQKIDSSATTVWECGSPFEWIDKEWMTKTYGAESKEKGTFENFDGKITTLYENNIQFITNNHIVLFDTALASDNTFKIRDHKIILDKNTTLEHFQKIFPNTEIENLQNKNEVRARLYLEKDSDDAFLFYFKNGKLAYFNLWWLLC